MNGRLHYEQTPEGRLAAIVVQITTEFEDRHRRNNGVGPRLPDVADLREALRLYVERELLKARIEESERIMESRSARTVSLVRQLYECEAKMPKEHRL